MCCVWLARARTRELVGAYRTAAATASQPHFPSSAGRVGVRRRPVNIPAPPCVARRAGGRSAMHQLGELLQKTLALHPTRAGSAISSIVLSFRAKGAIVPAGCAAPAAALPLARTSRCARKRGFGWGCAYQASSTSTSRLCLLVGAAGGARPRGAARRRFLSGVGGRACDAAPRGPWSPGDRRTRVPDT